MQQKLKSIREKRGLTQLELAVKSGVSLFVISGIETGRNVNPYYSAILKLAAALGVRPDEIMYREMPGSAA